MVKRIRQNQYLYYLVSLSLLLSITALVFFIAQGKRIKLTEEKFEIEGTGIINIKSYPDGAKILLNGQPKNATNTTISGLTEGKYSLDIIKEGFITWSKQVPVFNGLVTPIDALLISKTPKIEPLTNVGINMSTIANNSASVVFGVQQSEKPGLYLIQIPINLPVNIFKTNADVLILDTATTKYSNATEITWAPDDSEILIKLSDETYYLISTNTLQSTTTQLVASTIPELILSWQNEVKVKREKFLERKMKEIDINEEIKQMMLDPKFNSHWSPDGDKFFYTAEDEKQVKYRVYNLEQPLTIGGERDYVAFKLDKTKPQPVNMQWYIDSQHLIVVYGSFAQDNLYPTGTLYLIHMDGSNFTEIYSGQMTSPLVLATPSGDKLIITAKFRSDTPDELYSISLR